MGQSKSHDPNNLIRVAFHELKKEHEQLKATVNKTTEDTGQGSHRQVGLAFYYMQNSELYPRSSGTYTKDARLIEFLTGLPSSEIRKYIKSPEDLVRSQGNGEMSTKSLIADLNKIRDHFFNIGYNVGIDKIDKDLERLKGDLEDIKEDK